MDLTEDAMTEQERLAHNAKIVNATGGNLLPSRNLSFTGIILLGLLLLSLLRIMF